MKRKWMHTVIAILAKAKEQMAYIRGMKAYVCGFPLVLMDVTKKVVTATPKGTPVNADGAVDVYFGPKAPPCKERNWVQTVPGKGWNTILRLYGPLEPWFDKTWRPGEIKLQP